MIISLLGVINIIVVVLMCSRIKRDVVKALRTCVDMISVGLIEARALPASDKELYDP